MTPIAHIAAGSSVAPDPHRRWYAVQCQAHREKLALRHLVNQDFCAFLPLREKTRRHARKIETVLTPFFPGYIFVSLDLARARWRAINGTVGVAHLVMQGERPAPAPEGVVEALRDACDQNSVLAYEADIRRGEAVRVLTGPFADLIGELEDMDDTGRVRVLLDLMGGRMPVRLARKNVVPAESRL